MIQLVSPIISTTLVLVAVFVPVSMMPGITGSLYQQFALTISFAVIVSSINALTLSPALASIVIKRRGAHKKKFAGFVLFDRLFERLTQGYTKIITAMIRARFVVMVVFVILLGVVAYLFTATPTGFVPSEDKGALIVAVNLKPGSSIEQTKAVDYEVTKIIKEIPAVEHVVTVDGFNGVTSILDGSAGVMFVTLKPWEEREEDGEDVKSVIDSIYEKTAHITNATIAAFNLPGIPGIGNVGGFDFRLQNYLASDMNQFLRYAHEIIKEANADPRIANAFTTFNASYPMLYIDIDRKKANALGVNIADVFATMQTYLGAFYVNDFSKFGKVFRVFVQADKQYRFVCPKQFVRA